MSCSAVALVSAAGAEDAIVVADQLALFLYTGVHHHLSVQLLNIHDFILWQARGVHMLEHGIGGAHQQLRNAHRSDPGGRPRQRGGRRRFPRPVHGRRRADGRTGVCHNTGFMRQGVQPLSW